MSQDNPTTFEVMVFRKGSEDLLVLKAMIESTHSGLYVSREIIDILKELTETRFETEVAPWIKE